jgi:hypothetical protein
MFRGGLSSPPCRATARRIQGGVDREAGRGGGLGKTSYFHHKAPALANSSIFAARKK